ncbi:MAG: polymer-forming cytoskeletal protein [Gammaproteobacteria bacterium]|nr:polymer-forming cytoskeletal protein [Gammaproteobacteria bacterium]
MFELGKKEGGSQSDPVTSAAHESRSAPSSASSARSGSTQYAIIGRSIQINGDVKGDEDLVIEGDVSGTVELRNHGLTVGKEGKVKADIYARTISIDGATEGDLFASERIAIRASAVVKGNLVAPRVAIEDGARFKGSIEMEQQAVEKAFGSSAAKSGSPSKPEPVSNNKGNSDVKAAVSQPGGAVGAGRGA